AANRLNAAHGRGRTDFALWTRAVMSAFARGDNVGFDSCGNFRALGTGTTVRAIAPAITAALARGRRFGFGLSFDFDLNDGFNHFGFDDAFRTLGARTAFTRFALAAATG
ncbi:MAG TPA: hypothetical protein PLH31_11405, partial [Caulobacter sp.]|nr:hypothetical protein [Caulobacter sp.]